MNNNNFDNMFFFATVTGMLTFSIFAITSLSFNQASAQMTEGQTSLSLNSNPRGGTVTSGSTLPVYLLGELKSGIHL